MAPDVVQQLKKSEGLKEKNKHHEQHSEIKKELSQDVEVHQPREAAAGRHGHLMSGAFSVRQKRSCRTRAGLRSSTPRQAHSPAEISERPQPAAPIKKSVHPDFIICLEDGLKFKSLKRHLGTAYGMTPAQYREKWGLAPAK